MAEVTHVPWVFFPFHGGDDLRRLVLAQAAPLDGRGNPFADVLASDLPDHRADMVSRRGAGANGDT